MRSGAPGHWAGPLRTDTPFIHLHLRSTGLLTCKFPFTHSFAHSLIHPPQGLQSTDCPHSSPPGFAQSTECQALLSGLGVW